MDMHVNTWPANLFKQRSQNRREGKKYCHCGCGERHNHSVSYVETTKRGFLTVHKVYWFKSMRCKNSYLELLKYIEELGY